MTVALRLAQWAADLTTADLNADVRRAVGRHLYDATGCALAARRTEEAAPSLAVAAALGGPPEARVLGDVGRPPIGAVAAALATGALVHALDFDDTHAGGLVHASAVVLPAAFAVGQQVGATGEEVLVAAVVGYEVGCRIAAGSPHGFHARGLHATSVVGPLAAAAVTARLLRLSVEQTVHALGIAGSSSAGLLEFLHAGSSTKQLHPGLASAAGVLAARLAAAGATGPDSVVEGRYGLYATLSDRPADVASVTTDLGSRWETTSLTIKPYPACQLAHADLDAMAGLAIEPGDEVVRLTAQVHPDAVDVVCEPQAAKVRPRSPYDAKFSLPWMLAARVIDGRIGVDTFSPASIARADVVALAERVDVDVVPSSLAAADAPGRVTMLTRDGRSRTAAVHASRGGPTNPLDDEALQAKFEANAGGPCPAATRLLDLASVPDFTSLLAGIGGAW
jgi:2-methylcitrate dehydratase PrpD